MPPSQPEKKHSDIEMGAASKASPASTVPDATQSFVDGFRCFKDKLSRRNAEKRARAEATSVPSSLVPPSQAPGSEILRNTPFPWKEPLSPSRISTSKLVPPFPLPL
ncbi:Uncharacterized protein Rs2_41029 [Raphanus sativus]|nr:Uncharacterized protein Rs2_41029 [Raphanus sativus]